MIELPNLFAETECFSTVCYIKQKKGDMVGSIESCYSINPENFQRLTDKGTQTKYR